MKRLRSFGIGAVLACTALVALAAPAAAHVTVTAPGATSGGSDQIVTFRVPVERQAQTVELQVSLPAATPIASVLVLPVPGWTHTEKTATLANPIVIDDGDITEVVTQIDWKATPGHGLAPGEFGEFTIIAGRLPAATVLSFGAIQTYSDGSVVSWNQTATPGTSEPQFPAPTLTLAPASGTSQSSTPPATVSRAAKSGGDTGATVLAVIALVVAAAALGFGVVSRARSGRSL